MSEHLLHRDYHKNFILAGNSTFTALNAESGNRFTFRIRKAKKDDRKHYVSVMTGSDNERSYTYVGNVWKGNTFYFQNGKFHEQQSPERIYKKTQGAIAFAYIFPRILRGTLPECIELYHEGKCGHCGRKLTTPESVTTGIGPICDNRK